MLYYLHGYQSSPNGEKATLFKEALQALSIAYRDSSPEELRISDCLHRISEAISNDPQVILIGSSLGGFLAASTALTHPTVQHLILFNPAIIPPDIDLTTVQGMPLRILQEMQDPRLFQEKIPAAITILRGTLDDVVPDHWVLSFALAQQATIHLYTDDHRFSKNLHRLPKIISELIRKESSFP
ncbi:MAG: alpha/beta fold hydrolase [Candidatus Thermoplasmatota archaeon]|nr:alpha/beta fold hydrolase [Candidatus Thermoplasmatota archaeon]